MGCGGRPPGTSCADHRPRVGRGRHTAAPTVVTDLTSSKGTGVGAGRGALPGEQGGRTGGSQGASPGRTWEGASADAPRVPCTAHAGVPPPRFGGRCVQIPLPCSTGCSPGAGGGVSRWSPAPGVSPGPPPAHLRDPSPSSAASLSPRPAALSRQQSRCLTPSQMEGAPISPSRSRGAERQQTGGLWRGREVGGGGFAAGARLAAGPGQRPSMGTALLRGPALLLLPAQLLPPLPPHHLPPGSPGSSQAHVLPDARRWLNGPHLEAGAGRGGGQATHLLSAQRAASGQVFGIQDLL